jgi:hypothetical protein
MSSGLAGSPVWTAAAGGLLRRTPAAPMEHVGDQHHFCAAATISPKADDPRLSVATRQPRISTAVAGVPDPHDLQWRKAGIVRPLF